LRKLLIEEQSKNSKFEAIQQEKQFLEQKYESIKEELMLEKSRDTEVKLEAKIRVLQREALGRIYLLLLSREFWNNLNQFIDLQSKIDNRESKISQLESRLRKYDNDFVSGSLQTRDVKFKDSISDRVTWHSRTLSRNTAFEQDSHEKDKAIYELKVKIKDQELHIERLEKQLSKNLEALKGNTHRYIYM
jgi:hypothetical protein